MKKYVLLQTILIATIFLSILILSCDLNSFQNSKNEITVTNWNVQTFFDGNNDGVEYSEFRKSRENWNEEFYEDRLNRLCKIIEEIDSDIFVMEELENEKILYDISNKLSHNAWRQNKMYNYAAFGKEEKSSIGCGVISKHKIDRINFHGLDVRTESETAPQMRPVMEVALNIYGKNIVLFVNHWKSKSGGEEKSEKWRLWQENILTREFTMTDNGALVFATGDFNKDISDFNCQNNDEIIFTAISCSEQSSIQLYSPWEKGDINSGSYYFRGNWEKIDHFFFTDRSHIAQFYVEQNEKILKPDGTPNRYEIYNHQGFSDHLPITCKIILPQSEG